MRISLKGAPVIATEFIAELKSVRHMFKWVLEMDTSWPANRRSRSRFRIRAAANDSPNGGVFDPIGAVCYAKTGQIHDVDSWIAAATCIELSLIDAADITATANDRTWKSDGDGRVQDLYLTSLRERLVDAVGLRL